MSDVSVLKTHLDKQTYDKNYQDIECLGFKGYSESWKTWENIKNLVDWKDKKVVDLGTFHGYFSFKIAKSGAVVTGLDKLEEVLITARIINEIEETKVEFKQWEGGDIVSSEFNIGLCLNVLHHFASPEKALQNIHCQTVIFEINNDQIDLITKYFKIIKRVESHRNNRTILLTERRKNDSTKKT